MSTIIKSGDSSDLLKINSDKQVEVKLSNPVETSGVNQTNKVGSVRLMHEVDAGTKTGEAILIAPYTDQYYRQYTADSKLLDTESFNYTAQNTGKYKYTSTTLTFNHSGAGLNTNGGNVTTTSIGASYSSYAQFPLLGNSSLESEIVGSFSAQPTTNTIIDFGLFTPNASNPFTPTDGAYFRLTSAGLIGVMNNNGTETTSGVFAFNYDNSSKYRFYISVSVKGVQFWINDILYADLPTPIAQGQPFMSAAQPFSVRHAIVGGAAGSVINFNLNQYSVINLGVTFSSSLGEVGNRVFGSYQGLSGGTMGSLANYANNTNPTAAVPTNTTAALGSGLGGQFWETDTLALTTDGIIQSYQVPLGTASVPGKRLRILSLVINSYVQTALTGGGYIAQYSLCFGHTAVSLATAEAATTKAPRRIPLGIQSVSSGAAALTTLNSIEINFNDAPVYVNPGEFIAIAKKKVGTAPTAGVIAHMITYTYAWE